jgi:hypothetical protein
MGYPIRDLTKEGPFGRLAVIERDESIKGSQVRWWCQCECGKRRSVLAANLVRGFTKSCGCLGNQNQTVSFGGRTQSIPAWASELGITPQALRQRLGPYKWPISEALTTPSRRGDQ